MSNDQELAALRAELTDLAAAHRELLARVQQIIPTTAPTMARQLRCPACNATRIARIESVLDRGDSNSREEMALVKPSIWSSKVVGKLGCYACTQCGLVEWYVKEPDQLRDIDGRITILEHAPPDAPYR